MNKKKLIAITLVLIMLLSCIMPVLKVGAQTDVTITFGKNLYEAVRDELIKQGVFATYNDKQRSIVINDEEMAKVTELNLANGEIDDVTGLENFINLKKLDLSSNELNDESNLEVLSSLKLDVLDLSSNKISDVSKISNINTIPTLYLHDQKLSIVEIIEVDTTKESNQEDEMIFALPQILEHAGYLKSEWFEDTVKDNGPRVNWSGFDHKNLKIKVAEKTETTYIPYKGLLTVTIEITDSTNKLYNSEIKLYFAVVTSDERGIHIKDQNMYKAIKDQLLKGQKVNSDLISYYGTESNARKQLYERYYDEPQILVISINDLINNITSLKLSKKQIRDISGIEYFVGLTSELDLSNNYIKDVEPLLKLQENKEKEETLLRDRLSEKMALASETISKLDPIYDDIEKTIEEIKKIEKERDELLEKAEKLTIELQQLQAEKADLEGKLEGLDQDKVNLDEELKILQDELLELQNTKVTLEEELKALQDELAKLKAEHADLKVQMEQAGEANKDLEQQIANLEANIEKMKSDIETKTAEIDRINESIIVKNNEANQKQQAIYQAQEAIATYEVRISELNIQIQDKTKELGITLDEISNYVSMEISEEEITKIIKSYNNEFREVIINNGITDENEISAELSRHEQFIYAQLEQPRESIQNELVQLKDLIVNKNGQTTEEQFTEIQEILTNDIESINKKIIPDIIVKLEGDKEGNKDNEYSVKVYDIYIRGIKEIQQKIFANLNAKKIIDAARKLNTAYSSADAALDLNKLEAEVQTLVEEKLRLENLIADITNELKNGESGLLSQKNKIEEEIKKLEEQKIALEAEIKKIEEQIVTAEEELLKLKEELAASDATLEIEKLNQQIIEKEAEIDAKQKEIDTKQAEVDANNKAILDKEAEIKAKEEEIKAKEEEINKTKQEIKEKDNAITSKIDEINNILKDINSKNETIAGLELKLEQLQQNRDLLEKILLQRMSDIYESFRRVDKLASFAVPQLKTITDEEYDDLKYDEAKSLYDSQISRIQTIEENLNTFEYEYLIKTYSIPTVEIKEIEKVVLQPDGTLKTEIVTEEVEIKNPISKFFEEQSKITSDWNLSDYKEALYQFKTDDLYMNIYNYCTLYRYFNKTSNCQKDNFVNNLVKELNVDGQSTSLITRVGNNYNSKLSELDMDGACDGTAAFVEVVKITNRIITASGEDIDAYVVLPELKSLILTENLIENIDDITKLTGLRKLFVGDNEIVDISNVNWSELKELRMLDLSLNSISNIEALEVLEKLTYLDLNSNLINGKFTFDLSKLPNLEYLNLSNNQISDIEELVNYVVYEARNLGETTVDYLEYYLGLDITGQVLTMEIEDNFDLNERRKEELPKIFAQIEELDSPHTDFGIDSLGGNVTSDGKEVLLATNKYGTFNTVVTISSKYSNYSSIGEDTTCTITYKVGEDDVEVEDKNIKLSITPTTATVEQGKTEQFTATVTGNGSIDKTVSWKISGNTSLETKISANGLLTVASDEEAKTIRVEATSNEDPTISVGATVTIKENSTNVDPEEPDVPTKVTVTVTPSENVNIKTGEAQQFTVDIQGENIKERKIEWNLAGRTSQNTTITKEGLLTVGEDETANELNLTVKVTVNGEIENTKDIKIKVVKSETPIDPDKPSENSTLNTKDLGYKVDNEYLTEVKAKTPINEFEKILLNKLEYNVEVTKNGSKVTTGVIGTDMQIKVTDAEGKVVLDENGNKVIYKVVVKGDINGDGYANSLDTVLIKAHRNEIKVLEGSALQAGDINNDGNVNITDAKFLLYHRAEVTGFDLNFHK